MRVIPAIDMMGSRCVQLVGGDPKTRKDYGDPADVARGWVDEGARLLHLIDLDATLGTGDNLDIVVRIAESAGVPVQFGGGIRSVDKARDVLSMLPDSSRIIIGTLAVSEHPDYACLKELKDWRDRIIVSVDSKGGYVAVDGWQKSSRVKAEQVMESAKGHCWGFLYTDVDVEGKMQGINEETVMRVVSATDSPVIVSGGITTEEDVRICESAGAWGIVLGKALYEGKITIKSGE